MFWIDSESIILLLPIRLLFFLFFFFFNAFMKIQCINNEMWNVCVAMMIKWLQPTRRSFYGIFCDNKLNEIEFCYHFVKEKFSTVFVVQFDVYTYWVLSVSLSVLIAHIFGSRRIYMKQTSTTWKYTHLYVQHFFFLSFLSSFHPFNWWFVNLEFVQLHYSGCQGRAESWMLWNMMYELRVLRGFP